METSLMIIPKAPEKVLTEEEINRMFQVVKSDVRIHTMLKIMWQTGVRNTELRLLEYKDVDTKNKVITFMSLKKRGPDRVIPHKTIPINDELNTLIKMYERQFLPKSYFFFPLYSRNFNNGVVGNKKKPLSLSGIEHIINQVAIEADIQETHEIKKKNGDILLMKKVTPHTFRHSAATHIMRVVNDIELVKVMLDHESIMSTQKYLHYNLEDKKKKMEGVF